MEEPEVNKYLQQGWQISRFNHWLSTKEKIDFLNIVGEENIKVINEENKKEKWNAVILISPVGMQILNLYSIPPAGHA